MAFASQDMTSLGILVVLLAMMVPLVDGAERARQAKFRVEVLDEGTLVTEGSLVRDSRHTKANFDDVHNDDPDLVSHDPNDGLDTSKHPAFTHRVEVLDGGSLGRVVPLEDVAERAQPAEIRVEVLHGGSLVRDSMRRKSQSDGVYDEDPDPVSYDPNDGADTSKYPAFTQRVDMLGGGSLVRDSKNLKYHSDDIQAQDAPPVSEDQGAAKQGKSKGGKGEDEDNAGVDTSKYPDPHTWGDKVKNVMGLPSWAAALIGGVIAALVVIVANIIGNCLAHPPPFFSTEDQRLKDQMEQARAKVRLLEVALEERREKEKQEADKEARRAAGEPVVSDMPNDDELVGEVLYRTEQVQRNTVGAISNSITQAQPLIARATYVQSVFDHNVKLVRDRASDMAVREFVSMYKEMKGVTSDDGLGEALLDASGNDMGLISDWLTLDDTNDADPPPFALLLGGMFAPAQIKAVKSNCRMQMIWNSFFIAVCSACAIMDMNHKCNDVLVKVWFFGLLSINLLDIVCCGFVGAKCASELRKLEEDTDSIARIRPTGNAIWDMYINLQSNSGSFFKAYFAYEAIIDGSVYTCQKFCSFLSLFWGCYGVYLSIANILEDTLSCDAKLAVWFMHTYSGFFLMFVSWTILSLSMWILGKLAHTTRVTAPLMKAAKASDEEVPFKLPLFQLIARSFILRDSSTMLHIKARGIADDVYQMEADIEDTKRRLADEKYRFDRIESCRLDAVKHEADMMEKYKTRVREMGGSFPDDINAAETHEDAGSSSSAFADFSERTQQNLETSSTDFAHFLTSTRQNFAAADAAMNLGDGMDSADLRAFASGLSPQMAATTSLIGSQAQALAQQMGATTGLIGSQAQVLAQQAHAAAQSASASAFATATSTAESSMQQPLLQEGAGSTEPQASASSSESPETQPPQETQEQPGST